MFNKILYVKIIKNANSKITIYYFSDSQKLICNILDDDKIVPGANVQQSNIKLNSLKEN